MDFVDLGSGDTAVLRLRAALLACSLQLGLGDKWSRFKKDVVFLFCNKSINFSRIFQFVGPFQHISYSHQFF